MQEALRSDAWSLTYIRCSGLTRVSHLAVKRVS
jgi:hypothetical protein